MADGLETAPDPLQSLGMGRPLRVPTLTVAYHPEARQIGARLVLEGAVTLGRGATLFGPGVLDDDLASRRHAAVEPQRGGFVVRDLASRNGTFVNGKRVESAALQKGDVLAVGSIALVFGDGPARFTPADDPLIVGVSPVVAELLEEVAAVASEDLGVLVRGETGVGKELVARRIHELSGRAGAFVAVNCGGLSDSVLGSELFGHVRGAFSGADSDRPGLVAAADGGTLLLDEIGDASPQFQTSLLRLLQEREIRPVGSDRNQPVDVRFVAATHVRLDPAVAAGRFRRDLLARLRRWVIDVPPLRERREDIVPIARSIARARLGREVLIERPLALALLSAPWRDNVRGLAAIVEAAAIEGGASLALTPRVSARLEELRQPAAPSEVGEDLGEAVAIVAHRKQRPDAAHLTRRFVALEGNMKALAAELGVARNTLYRWFREAKLDPETLR